MKEQDQIKVLAELDDPQHKWEITHFQSLDVLVGYRYPAGTGWIFSKPYLTSRDAVTPVIEKWVGEDFERAKLFEAKLDHVIRMIDQTTRAVSFLKVICGADRLSEALLRATGKWKE